MSDIDDRMTRLDDDGMGLLMNMIAEYCFGNVSEQKYKIFLSTLDEDQAEYISKIEQAFKTAIRLGLTHKMSTNGDEEAADIWEQVEMEMNQ